MRGTPRDSPWARKRNRESYPGEAETHGPCPLSIGKLGFLSIFKITQVSSHFEALNSELLSSCQRDVRPPLIMRQGPRAFSRFSTSDSDIHISCQEKDVPAFEPLQGNPAFFQVSTSPCPFPIQKQTLCPTNIPIAERILLLRCLWIVGITLEGISSHVEFICGTWSSFLFLRCPHGPSRLVRVFLWILWCSIKELKAPFLYELEHEIFL